MVDTIDQPTLKLFSIDHLDVDGQEITIVTINS